MLFGSKVLKKNPDWVYVSQEHYGNQFCIKPNDSRQLYLISLVILNEHSGGPLRPNQSRSLKRSFRNWLRLGRVWPWLVIELNLWDWREWSKFFHSTPAISTKCKELNNYVDIKFHLFQFILIGKKKIQIKQKNKKIFLLPSSKIISYILVKNQFFSTHWS